MEYIVLQNTMQEETLYEWWRRYARNGKIIHTGGHRLRIIESGHLNRARGPDFISARFELDGVIYQGDVECHVFRDDWLHHQHHLDKAYRSVLLHITADAGSQDPVFSNWNKHPIPTVGLLPPEDAPDAQTESANCFNQALSDEQLVVKLQKLALERFELKIKKFLSLLEHENEDQVFYEFFLRALGYPHNADAFQFLAGGIRWLWLTEHHSAFAQNPETLYAIYAGQAGFIPVSGQDPYTRQLVQTYNDWTPRLKGIPMQPLQWQYAAVRPRNHPHLRLACWVYLASQSDFHLKDRLYALLIGRRSLHETAANLRRLLTIPAGEYWAVHYALGKPHPGRPVSHLPGESRIAELLINVILPFFSAKAMLRESTGFQDYLAELFLALPLAQSYSRFDKYIPLATRARKLWPAQALNQAFLQLG